MTAIEIGPKNTNLAEDIDILSSIIEFSSVISKKKSKMS